MTMNVSEGIAVATNSPVIAHLQCLSHSPLISRFDPAPAVKMAAFDALEKLRDGVRKFSPDLIFMFAPDHYNGFFYDCMPQFCIGMQASSVGDYGSGTGELLVPKDIARACAQALCRDGIDIAVSYRMKVDHGFTQPLTLITGHIDAIPVVPIFINCVASPLPTMRRARLLGEAIGRYARSLKGCRILFVGSGGLSHNPPIPAIENASPEVAERLIAGRNITPQQHQQREQRVVETAQAFSSGNSELHPLNPEWDLHFLHLLKTNAFAVLDTFDNDEITSAAGASAHEVKTWVAALAAMAQATDFNYELKTSFYQAIPEWIAGFGVMEGTQLPNGPVQPLTDFTSKTVRGGHAGA